MGSTAQSYQDLPSAGRQPGSGAEIMTGAQEPESFRVRSLLMAHLRQLMKSRNLTQVQAARWFRVSQSRVSHLVNGRVTRFTADTLVNMLAHAGVHVELAFRCDAAETLNVGDGTRKRSPDAQVPARFIDEGHEPVPHR